MSLKRTALSMAVTGAAQFLIVSPSSAQDISDYLLHQPTQSDFGGVGLMQMPTARMNRPGEFTLSYYDNEEYRRMALSMQMFPWLEATIRYNDVRTRLYSSTPEFSGDQTYKDRGVDVKFRLIEESRWVPELSVGLRDLAGTGKFAGEFVVASKRYESLDFTLGIGWGNLGTSDSLTNPFCELSDEFCTRSGAVSDTGGSLEADKWFRGSAAIFAGVEYQTPWEPLSLKVEYEGNDYSEEFSGTPITQDSRFNFGAHYRLGDNVNVQISYERGNTWMFGFNFRTNFNDISQYKVRPRERSKEDIKQRPESFEDVDMTKTVNAVRREGGWYNQRIELSEDGKTLSMLGYPVGYLDQMESIERSSKVLLAELPPSVEKFQFIDQILDMPLAQTNVDAKKLQDNTVEEYLTDWSDVYELSEVAERQGQVLFDRPFEIDWPRLGARPYLVQSFGGPENFYMYQLSMDLQLDWRLSPHWVVNGSVGVNLLTNYDDFNFLVPGGANAPLPRVRTYIREYVTQSDVWLDNLQATYVKQWNKDLYSSFYGGYFERMFGGIGFETLYNPLNKGWALGIDINYAKQRSFENYTGFRDYSTVTGHVTGYWKIPNLDDVLVKLAVGRFLAEDVGAQLNFEKKFDSGIIIGAYAAKTDVSSEDYGEGSFTKGFYLSIPFDLMQVYDTVGRASFGWTPLTRDGGQMLMRSQRLFGVTEPRNRYYTESDLYK
ncbi:YjbH domain-containing protein [Idiomarina sp.]|uniref:YjbH domain-containing protein n=1 Tax=Idiomarina sp. TaxID=1874361 RepID=UPI00351621D4